MEKGNLVRVYRVYIARTYMWVRSERETTMHWLQTAPQAPSGGGQRNLEWRREAKLGRGWKKDVVSVSVFLTTWIFVSPWHQLVSNSLPLSRPMSMLMLFSLLFLLQKALSAKANTWPLVKVNPPTHRIGLLLILRILLWDMRFEFWSRVWAPALTQHKELPHAPSRSYNKA